jgi:hypothetical protein
MAVNLALKLQDKKDPKRRTEEERSIRDASAVAYAGKHESLFYYIATYYAYQLVQLPWIRFVLKRYVLLRQKVDSRTLTDILFDPDILLCRGNAA